MLTCTCNGPIVFHQPLKRNEWAFYYCEWCGEIYPTRASIAQRIEHDVSTVMVGSSNLSRRTTEA